MSWNIGGFLSGNQVSLSPTLNIRQGGRLTSSLRWTRNDIDLPQGAFVTNLGDRAPDLQLLDARQRVDADSVQRSDAPLVHEPALQLAAHRRHRPLRRLQRHRGLQRTRPGEPGVHHQVLAHAGPARLKRRSAVSHTGTPSRSRSSRLAAPPSPCARAHLFTELQSR